MKKRFCRILSVILLLSIVAVNIPMQSFAAEDLTLIADTEVPIETTPLLNTEPNQQLLAESTQETPAVIVREDVSLRDEFVKHFEMSDGSYTATIYNEPVHQLVDGAWVEVDNTLALSTSAKGEAQYRSVNGLTDVSFAQNFSNELVTMEQDDYSITWGVEPSGVPMEMNSVASAQLVGNLREPVQAEILPLDISAAAAEEQKTFATNTTSRIQYADALANGVDLEYTVLPSRIKESIILNSPQSISAYTVTINASNLSARLLDNREVEFYTEDSETVFTMWAPYMYDSASELSENIAVELTALGNGQYAITLTPDAAWLNSPDRVYPVVIDPDVSVSRARTNIIDNTVMEGQGNQNRNLDRLYIGRKSGARVRAFLKYDVMPTIPSGATITAATQTLYITSGTDTGSTAGAYIVTGGDWASDTITWDNRPTAATTIQASISHNNFSYYRFSCLSAVQKWYTGSTTGKNANYGITVRYTDETINDYNAFYSADYSVESSRPLLTIQYTEHQGNRSISVSPSNATINVGSTKSLTVSFTPTTTTNKSVTWSTSNAEIAKVSTSGVVTGIAPGTATIKCTSDDSGATSTCLFTILPTSYTTLMLNTSYVGALSAGRHWWYQFTPSETGYYLFSNGADSVNVRAYLFNGSTQLAYDYDSGEGNSFEIRYKLSAGTTYRLRVQGVSTSATGIFTVKVCKGWPAQTKPSILARSNWGAADVIADHLVLRTRAPERIIYHHSAEKFSSTNLEECAAEIKRIQNLHMNTKNKCDIAYHFVIDPAGRIWQGAEIDDYQRGHATGYFDDIGVLVLGDFESRLANLWSPNTLNTAQQNAMTVIAKWLCSEYDIPVDISFGPITTHRQVVDTECPGANMAPWVENELLSFILNWRKN